jgi:hypothetical protein
MQFVSESKQTLKAEYAEDVALGTQSGVKKGNHNWAIHFTFIYNSFPIFLPPDEYFALIPEG